MSTEVLLKGVTPTLGEGPHWDTKTESLFFVDVITSTVYKWDSNTMNLESKTLNGNKTSIIIPRESGGYVVSCSNRLETLDWETGTTSVLAELDQADKHILNDGKCDAMGRLWVGTMGSRPIAKLEDAEVHIGNLYSVDHDSKTTLRKDKLTIPNGLAWTKDNKRMFYIDSAAQKVWSYDFDVETGNISNEQTCVDCKSPQTNEDIGVSETKEWAPDGMTIDTDNKIWVACFGIGKVIRFDPETGKVLRCISFPAARITSCCFGGRHLDELYVTSSQFRMTEDEPKEFAGSVFRVTGLGVKGIPAYNFKG